MKRAMYPSVRGYIEKNIIKLTLVLRRFGSSNNRVFTSTNLPRRQLQILYTEPSSQVISQRTVVSSTQMPPFFLFP